MRDESVAVRLREHLPARRETRTCRARTRGSRWTARSSCRRSSRKCSCGSHTISRPKLRQRSARGNAGTGVPGHVTPPPRPAGACWARSRSTSCIRDAVRGGRVRQESAGGKWPTSSRPTRCQIHIHDSARNPTSSALVQLMPRWKWFSAHQCSSWRTIASKYASRR